MKTSARIRLAFGASSIISAAVVWLVDKLTGRPISVLDFMELSMGFLALFIVLTLLHPALRNHKNNQK